MTSISPQDDFERTPRDHVKMEVKHSATGTVLVPQPSNEPNDPLNWPMAKKVLTLGIVTLATFVGIAQAPIVAAGVSVQGKLYGRTTVEMAYSVGTINI